MANRSPARPGRNIAIDDGKVDFPVVPANCVQFAALAKVQDLLARPFFTSPRKYGIKL